MIEQLSAIASKSIESLSEVYKETAIKCIKYTPLQYCMETIENVSLESLEAQNAINAENLILPAIKNNTLESLQQFKIEEFPERKGGAYRDIPSKEGYEKHHMPADSTTEIPFQEGPCIQMEIADHRQTASWGMSREAQEYRSVQKELREQGRFEDAFRMDIEDIREKFGNKYDEAISQAEEYMEQLKQQGRV